MTVNPTSTATGATPVTPASSGMQNVSIQEFMQLLSTEMQNQDPLQPMDPTQSMTQLAQFTTLQQMTQLSQTQSLATANALLGSQVTVPGAKNQTVTGTVTGIDSSGVASGTQPSLQISGSSQEFPLTAVTHLQDPPPATSTSTSSTGG